MARSSAAPKDRENRIMDDLETTAPAGQPIIIMTRTLNAPRALVWEAWTTPKHIEKWWGWRDANVVVQKLDFRPGGAWRIQGHGLDGSVYTFVGTYKEIVKPERIVNTFGVEGMFDGRELVETHTFEEADGKTLYKSVSRFDSIADRDGMLATGMETGARESMDQLDELLQTMKQ
jgi:uncharacterized protein YndB with AHSA1/START domain